MSNDAIEALINAARAAERERCAKIARDAARSTKGYKKTTALFIAQRIEEHGLDTAHPRSPAERTEQP